MRLMIQAYARGLRAEGYAVIIQFDASDTYLDSLFYIADVIIHPDRYVHDRRAYFKAISCGIPIIIPDALALEESKGSVIKVNSLETECDIFPCQVLEKKLWGYFVEKPSWWAYDLLDLQTAMIDAYANNTGLQAAAFTLKQTEKVAGKTSYDDIIRHLQQMNSK